MFFKMHCIYIGTTPFPLFLYLIDRRWQADPWQGNKRKSNSPCLFGGLFNMLKCRTRCDVCKLEKQVTLAGMLMWIVVHSLCFCLPVTEQ